MADCKEKEIVDQVEEVQESEETETPAKSPEAKETEVEEEEEETKVENEEEEPTVTENGGNEKESSEQGTSKDGPEEKEPACVSKNGEEEKEPACVSKDGPEEKEPACVSKDGPEEKEPACVSKDGPEEKEPACVSKDGPEEKEPACVSKDGPEEKESACVSKDGQEEKEPACVSKDDQEEKEPAKEPAEGHGTTVAKHYNEHPENTREERRGSRIFYLRNFNNWIKSVLINEVLEKIKKKSPEDITVLDLACGKGGDLLKWQKGRVSNLICADIADVSMKQCEQRYKDMQKNRHSRRYQDPLFDIQFITADCTKVDLNEQYNDKNKDIMFDMTSCQFALHYSFESQEQAEKMLENCCAKVKPGGYFIGTVPCANELVKRLRESEDMSFGNEVYTVTFTEKEEFPLFGHKYNFHLDGVVDCPEFLVHFPMLEMMAEKFDMKLEFTKGFHDFFHEHLTSYKSLMYRMQALETYPPKRDNDKLTSSQEDAYSEAKDFLDGAKSGTKEVPDPKYRDHRNKGANHVGTLSKDEWEAVGIYMVFAFKKAEAETPMEEEKPEESEEKKEVAEVGGDDEKKEEDEKMEDDGEKEEDDGEKEEEDKKVEDKKVEVKKEDEEKKEEDEKEDKKEEEVKKEDEEKSEDEGEKEEEDNEDEGKKEEEDKKVEDKKEDEERKEDEEKKDEGATKAVEMEAEPAEEAKTTTPQRATRKRRSVGKDEAAKKTEEEQQVETKPKRETRKRKSTGGTAGTEEEPPEKKKA